MHSFKTVPDIQIATGGAAQLDRFVSGLAAGRRILIVTDKGVRGLGLIDEGIEALRSAQYDVSIFDAVVADPPEHIVLAGAQMAREMAADIIIGFGGGSPMDTAKVIAHLAANDQPIEALYGVGNAKGPRLPLLLVPTTAGTGSEVTNVAILTLGKGIKKGVVADALYADRVLLDAALTTGLPKMITASTGIDAMVHAIEAYTSLPQKNPISDALAISALQKLSGAVERACADGNDIEARGDMLIGAMLAGQAFSNAPCAAVHALAYPLGGFYHVPHGLSNALVLTEVMKYNQKTADGLYGELADALRFGSNGAALIDEMQRIKDETKVPQTLASVKIPEDAIDMLAEDAMTKERLLINNPREMTLEAVQTIYRNIA